MDSSPSNVIPCFGNVRVCAQQRSERGKNERGAGGETDERKNSTRRGDDMQQGHKLDSNRQHLEYAAAGWEITTSHQPNSGSPARLLHQPGLAGDQKTSFGVPLASKSHIQMPKQEKNRVNLRFRRADR